MPHETTFSMIPCDLCGERKLYRLPEADQFGTGGVCVCSRCGFVFVPVRRNAGEIAAAWEDIYAGGGYTANWPMVKARLTYVAEWYGQLYGWTGKSVLEIGAGEGHFLDLCRLRGAFPVGIEPSAEGCRSMRSKDIFAHHGTVEKCGQVGTFDVVVMVWTLENTQDCMLMLRAAKQNLAPGGHLLIATGSRILTGFRKPLSTYFSRNPPDCHSFRFSANTLARAMSVAGIPVISMNDYKQADWMVAVGKPGDEPTAELPKDDPIEVLDFFNTWAKLYA